MDTGRIVQINVSDGGVPKLPVPATTATRQGLTDDRQRNLKVHGGPNRALCLYSLERIINLQAEGHPIYAGSTGENLTLAGVEWEHLVPGVRLRLGPEVVIEITSYTSPCPTIAGSFLDEQFLRISQDHHPGWSRLYARLVTTGQLQIGDRVEILDDQGEEP
ncbi:MAG: MOSC domain-containing protein [Anaerolineae bacterium]|jgi:MOSC domain-containing protein YiiM